MNAPLFVLPNPCHPGAHDGVVQEVQERSVEHSRSAAAGAGAHPVRGIAIHAGARRGEWRPESSSARIVLLGFRSCRSPPARATRPPGRARRLRACTGQSGTRERWEVSARPMTRRLSCSLRKRFSVSRFTRANRKYVFQDLPDVALWLENLGSAAGRDPGAGQVPAAADVQVALVLDCVAPVIELAHPLPVCAAIEVQAGQGAEEHVRSCRPDAAGGPFLVGRHRLAAPAQRSGLGIPGHEHGRRGWNPGGTPCPRPARSPARWLARTRAARTRAAAASRGCAAESCPSAVPAAAGLRSGSCTGRLARPPALGRCRPGPSGRGRECAGRRRRRSAPPAARACQRWRLPFEVSLA